MSRSFKSVANPKAESEPNNIGNFSRKKNDITQSKIYPLSLNKPNFFFNLRRKMKDITEYQMYSYSLNEPNSFFVKILRFFVSVDSLSPSSLLTLMFSGPEFKKMLYDRDRYNYHKNTLSDSQVQHFLENDKIKENPIEEIEKRLNIGEKFRFSLYKNQLNVMEAFNFGAKEIHKEYIDAVISVHSKDMEWIPDIATEIGEYDKNEVFKIFNSLSFDSKKQLFATMDTSAITDLELLSKLENIKNCKTEEEFSVGFKSLQSSSFKEINGANILLGLCKVDLLEKLTKKEFIEKLAKQNKDPQSQKTILATALNKSTTFEIHSPKGVTSKDAMMLASFNKNITPEQFKEKCNKNPKLATMVWSSEGNTYTDYKQNQSKVNVANTENVIDTFLHEGTHANLASLIYTKHLKFFPDVNKQIEQKLYKKINQNLKNLDIKFEEILNSKNINVKNILNALGITAENKEEETELLIFSKVLNILLNGEKINQEKNPYLAITNPFLRLKYIIERVNFAHNTEYFEKYKNIYDKTNHKIAEFLEKEDYKNSGITNKDTVKLIEDIYLTPNLNPIYANKGKKIILEESVVRVNEYRNILSKVLPNSKPINKFLHSIDRMEELMYFQVQKNDNTQETQYKEMNINSLKEMINPCNANVNNLDGNTGNKYKFDSIFGKKHKVPEQAPPEPMQNISHRLILAEKGHIPNVRENQN